AGVVAVGVHIPAGALHGDEAGAGFDEPAGHQHLLAENRWLEDLLAALVHAGVVALDELLIFLGNVESLAGPAGDEVDGLLLKLVVALGRIAGVEAALEIVELLQE